MEYFIKTTELKLVKSQFFVFSVQATNKYDKQFYLQVRSEVLQSKKRRLGSVDSDFTVKVVGTHRAMMTKRMSFGTDPKPIRLLMSF